jgi:hypothetical protein
MCDKLKAQIVAFSNRVSFFRFVHKHALLTITTMHTRTHAKWKLKKTKKVEKVAQSFRFVPFTPVK